MNIFVSIASYRDDKCPTTIKDLYSKAANPSNIFIGLCLQNYEEDVDCFINDYADRIKIIKMNAKDAKGPCIARYLCSTLYNGEDYFLQIDSHMLFVKDWDLKFIKMYKELEKICPKPVISYYPNDKESDSVSRICKAIIDKERNIITFQGAYLLEKAPNPTISGFVTAGCFFAKGSFLNDVSYDPHLADLFTGEEILFSARLWTSGWDIFSPNENLLFHAYDRKNNPKFWDEWIGDRNDTNVLHRVRYLLELGNINNIPTYLRLDLSKYGMGKVRRLDDYWNFIGFNPDTGEFTKNFCQPLGYIENFPVKKNKINLWIVIGIIIVFFILCYVIKYY